jgi:enoyl-CoA hydratase/carnithine racemase
VGEVISEVVGGCGVVTLSSPGQLNAWDRGMQTRVTELLRDFGADPAVRGVVVTGAGDAFSSGQDLAEVAQFATADVEPWLERFRTMYHAALLCPKPVVAAINGVAAGSAYQFALTCDVRVSHAQARIGQPEVRSGIPSITGLYLTEKTVGMSRAREMLLSGRLLSGHEALAYGLVSELVDRPIDLVPRAIEIAQDLATNPPDAFRLTKQRFFDLIRPGMEESFQTALKIDLGAYEGGEPQRVAREFLDRRRKESAE